MSETYQLLHPITRRLRVAGGAETEEIITEVEIRRLNGGDMRWIQSQEGKPGLELGIVARLTGYPAVVVDLLDVEDIAEIAKVIEGFTPASLRTGKTS